ncbi:MAG: protocatechuate dioxygenase [Gammaproteobacteria bacterium]|nr:protocatechuate dioxygenase [Gammaproteobacteria bacterium]
MANGHLRIRPIWRAAPAGAVDRRRLIAGFAAGAAGALVSRPLLAQAPGRCVLTPDSGEGPFYFDPDLVRVDITEGVPGAPLELSMQVVRASDCATLDGARVDVWHADAIGLYSGYRRQPGTGEPSYSVEGRTFLRGTQFTDAGGNVRFRTIYPSWYGGRTPHVHFKIFLGGDEAVASQLFFPDEFNSEVFERYAPYNERAERRRTFNDGDSFLRGGRVVGAFCDMRRTDGGYRGEAVVAVETRNG